MELNNSLRTVWLTSHKGPLEDVCWPVCSFGTLYAASLRPRAKAKQILWLSNVNVECLSDLPHNFDPLCSSQGLVPVWYHAAVLPFRNLQQRKRDRCLVPGLQANEQFGLLPHIPGTSPKILVTQTWEILVLRQAQRQRWTTIFDLGTKPIPEKY